MPISRGHGHGAHSSRPGIIVRRKDITRSERGLDAWRFAQAKQAGLRLASFTPTAPASDPVLQEHYASDRVICQLEVDLASRVWGYQQSYLCSHACLVPCLAIPINICCCPTVYLCLPCCFPAYEGKVAAAHRLVLRERTLLFEVDEHFGVSSLAAQDVRGTQNEVPGCCEPGGPCPASLCGTPIGAHSATIRLADVANIALESGTADAPACTDQRRPDQLIVINAAGIVVAAIAGPKDAQGFIDRVQSQKQRVLAESLDEDAPAGSVPLTGPSATGGMLGNAINMMNSMFGAAGGGGVCCASGMSGMSGMGGMGGMGGTTMMSVAPQQYTMQRAPEPPIITGTVVTPAAAGGGGLTEGLVKLSQMRQAGELTDEEFAQAKRQLLGGAN